VRRLAVFVELRLERSLKLFPVRSMTGALRPENNARASATEGFYGNIPKPLRDPDRRLFHL